LTIGALPIVIAFFLPLFEPEPEEVAEDVVVEVEIAEENAFAGMMKATMMTEMIMLLALAG
jgi:hypothetical protein